MEDTEFDHALIASAFERAAMRGWTRVSVAEAARDAGLPLARARARFPNRAAVLLRFGVLADQGALEGPNTEPTARERLFDIVMRRFDAMQPHRDGIIALLRGLPTDPGSALLLYTATLRSMAWMLAGAGVPVEGLSGVLRTQGMLGVWLYALRAWERDDSPDLSGTMAALDRALDRAVGAERWLPGGGGGPDAAAEADAATDEAVAAAPPPFEPPPSPLPPPEPPASSPPIM